MPPPILEGTKGWKAFRMHVPHEFVHPLLLWHVTGKIW